jgi:hypothetical protein
VDSAIPNWAAIAAWVWSPASRAAMTRSRKSWE